MVMFVIILVQVVMVFFFRKKCLILRKILFIVRSTLGVFADKRLCQGTGIYEGSICFG